MGGHRRAVDRSRTRLIHSFSLGSTMLSLLVSAFVVFGRVVLFPGMLTCAGCRSCASTKSPSARMTLPNRKFFHLKKACQGMDNKW